jgi:hypothetical protein
MNKTLTISFVVFVVLVSVAVTTHARELEREVPIPDEQFSRTGPAGAVVGAVHGVFGVNQTPTDTFYYGGTIVVGGVPYAAEPSASGWANGKIWTWSATGFNGTAHSGLNMDGWVGVDNTVQMDDYFHVADNATMGATCVIAGNKSLLCGVTNEQGRELCYGDQTGTGYGNDWRQTVVTKTYTHNAGNQITLVYAYGNQSEPGYDSTYVTLQTYDPVGAKWIDHSVLARYTGVMSGTETFDVDSRMTGLTPPVQFRIKFNFISDGGYSDIDNGFPTSCGAFLLDSYALTGDVADSEDFESVSIGSLPAGWQTIVSSGVGEFARAKHLNDLPIDLNQDPCVAAVPWLCGMADSVIVLYDPAAPQYPHPCGLQDMGQDNYVVSPIIDLSGHPGLGGKILQFERFANLPMADHVFIYWQIKYKPACESGGWSAWVRDYYFYYTPEGTSCAGLSFDVSSYIPPTAQQVQIAIGVINECCGEWWGGCSQQSNATPYFDNATFATFGPADAPYISMGEIDYWQDQFAEDGTLNPTSTADTRTPNYLSNLAPPIFGDTLVCRGGADNMEVYFVFRMAKVGARQPTTHPFFTTWFPGVAGGGWIEAGMDTAEYTNAAGTGTIPFPGRYMACFHEQDPVRIANAFPECREILPNNLFVPGTRIEYFLKAKYSGSVMWFMFPDTTEGKYEEFEILPMMSDDGTGGLHWPCLIVADHFGRMGNWSERNSHRIARHLKANNLRFDTFNRLGPASDLRNGIGRWAANPGQIGGPGTDKYNWGPGATIVQMLGYYHCILNAGSVYGYSIYQPDVDMINSWLTTFSSPISPKFFWLSGDQVVRELNRRTPWGKNFLNNILCATYVHSSYAEQNNDFTFCLPMNGVASGRIACGEPESYIVRSNGCPRGRALSVIGVSTASGCNALAEIEYDSRATKLYAAVSNVVNNPTGANYKTFTEGYDNCLIRTNASQGPLVCGSDSFMTTWFACILTWGNYDSTWLCPPPDIGIPQQRSAAPALVTSLGQNFPNPMNPAAKITYTVGKSGRVWLRVFDVSGRVIRTLVDQYNEARREPYEVIWDGTNDRGERASSGVFFYQLDVPGYKSTKKIVILR